MFRNNKRAVRFPARSSRAVHFHPVAISSSEKLLIPPKTKIVASLCVVVRRCYYSSDDYYYKYDHYFELKSRGAMFPPPPPVGGKVKAVATWRRLQRNRNQFPISLKNELMVVVC